MYSTRARNVVVTACVVLKLRQFVYSVEPLMFVDTHVSADAFVDGRIITVPRGAYPAMLGRANRTCAVPLAGTVPDSTTSCVIIGAGFTRTAVIYATAFEATPPMGISASYPFSTSSPSAVGSTCSGSTISGSGSGSGSGTTS